MKYPWVLSLELIAIAILGDIYLYIEMSLRRLCLFLFIVFGLQVFGTASEPNAERFNSTFRLLKTEYATLAPDGRHLAYTVFDGDTLSIMVAAVGATPAPLSAAINVKTYKWDGSEARESGDAPVKIHWLGWADANRLVIVAFENRPPWRRGNLGLTRPPRSAFAEKIGEPSGTIQAFDADGTKAQLLASFGSSFFAKFHSVEVVGLVPATTGSKALLVSGRSKRSGNNVVDRSNYIVDIHSGRIRRLTEKETNESIAMHINPADETLSKECIGKLALKFPSRSVSILSFDEKRERALVLVQGIDDPGAFHVVTTKSQESLSVVNRSDAPGSNVGCAVSRFDFADGNFANASGWIALPSRTRLNRAPIVILDLDVARPLPYATMSCIRASTSGNINPLPAPIYRPEVVALTTMGFAVVQIANATPHGGDPVAARIAEVKYVVSKLAEYHAVNPRQVALYGSEAGGATSLAMLARAPGFFRCAVAIEPTYTLQTAAGESWRAVQAAGVYCDNEDRPKLGVSDWAGTNTDQYTVSVIFAVGAPATRTSHADRGSAVVETLRPNLILDPDLALRRAAAFRCIEDFLNLRLYNYHIDAGESKILDD